VHGLGKDERTVGPGGSRKFHLRERCRTKQLDLTEDGGQLGVGS